MFGEITIEESKYPTLLRKIPDPPKALYYKGSLDPEIFDTCLAVVGSRRVSSYGKKAIKHIFSTLSKNITIVSGFMRGVDAEAHKEALRLGLKTIAVMPCGIDQVYPESQEDLYEEIVNSCLILSEYKGSLEPKPWTHPKRNRIVAGLSWATLVIESKLDSGSLITANLAHSYGRSVFVVPGSIFDENSEGNIYINNAYAKGIRSGLQINKYFDRNNDKNSVLDYQNNPILYTLKSG
ncbi:DNA-processing protein DprA [Patescibacteria group bacterium]